MDGEEKRPTPTGGNENADTVSDTCSTPELGKKPKNLKDATSLLRAEALRRYRLKHGQDPPDQEALDEETALAKDGKSQAKDISETEANSSKPEPQVDKTGENNENKSLDMKLPADNSHVKIEADHQQEQKAPSQNTFDTDTSENVKENTELGPKGDNASQGHKDAKLSGSLGDNNAQPITDQGDGKGVKKDRDAQPSNDDVQAEIFVVDSAEVVDDVATGRKDQSEPVQGLRETGQGEITQEEQGEALVQVTEQGANTSPLPPREAQDVAETEKQAEPSQETQGEVTQAESTQQSAQEADPQQSENPETQQAENPEPQQPENADTEKADATQAEDTEQTEKAVTPTAQDEQQNPQGEAEQQAQVVDTQQAESGDAPQAESGDVPQAESGDTQQAVEAETQKAEDSPQEQAESTEKQEAEDSPQEQAESTEKQEAEDSPQEQAESSEKQEAEDSPQEQAESSEKQEAEDSQQVQAESSEKQEAEDSQQAQAESSEKQEAEAAPEGSSEQIPETPAEQAVEGEGRPGSGKEKGQLDEQASEKPAEQTKDGSGQQTQEAEVTPKGEGEEEEEGEEQKEEEEEVLMPEDFYYNFEEQMSKARVTQESGLPDDLLKLQHSFGYDCRRRANLFMLDSSTLMYIAGNLVELLNINTKEQRYIRSTSGGGIGALAVHPSRKYFAVAEKGHGPNINIFEFPSLKLYRILRGGTERVYSSMDFSPDGDLLTSVGGDPDFMLTVWNWKQEKTTLRSKAFSQEVFRATFSTELEGQLTTAGTGHIRFWKMADTFTGLKLQGELGRFGKTEISDIDGYVELPDGKVLSGSEWGNMLLWDGGLIKVEIGRKNKKSCHHGPIQQVLLDEGELMTIGVDGFVRMWDFEAIDTADSTDDTGLFEMEPMNELRVSHDAQLRSIVKSVDDENEPTIWYAQDANGGIWRLDLSFSHTSHAPEKVMTYHAGPITACDPSPLTDLVATSGVDSTVRVFDLLQKKQLCEGRFNSSSTCIVWTPQIVDRKGSTLIAGFEDGVVRMLTFNRLGVTGSKRHKGEEACELALKQVFKPHKNTVTALAIDYRGEILASGGTDNTVFFMHIGDKEFEPIGFVQLTAAVRSLQWSPDKFSKTTLLAFCEEGNVFEIEAPDPGKFDTSHSYQITGLPVRSFTFRSIKSKLRHEEELERKRIEDEARKKKEEDERRRRIERGLETESEHGDDEEEEEKPKEEDWKPFIPPEPSPILYGFYSEEGKFWLSMGEFDAGYLYECKFQTDAEKATANPDLIGEPIRAVPVLESDDTPITTIQFSRYGQQAMFGMENGEIRIQQLENKFDLSDLGPYWTLSMHDNNYGHVTSLKCNFDGSLLLTTGADGNFFQFEFMEDAKLEKKIAENKAKIPSARKQEEKDRLIDDIEDPNAYSIEDAKQKSEYDKMMKEAEEKKRDVRRRIAKLRRQFRGVLEKNESLPKHIQLGKGEFEMDREIKLELERHTQEKIEVVRKELAWESEKHRIALEKLRKRFKDVVECERIVLKAFMTPHEVSSFRANKLSDDFYQLKADFERRRTLFSNKDDITRDPTRDLTAGQLRGDDSGDGSGEKTEDGGGARILTSLKGSMGERITKALQKVEEKKKRRSARRAEWEDLYEEKPDDDYEDPADVSAIKEAKENMGDYKLKTASDYVVPDHLRMNVEKARGRLLVLKDLIHEYKYDFNVKLLALRDKKIRIIEQIRHHIQQLQKVQAGLTPEKHRPMPAIPEMQPDELPEKKLEYTRETLIQFKKQMAVQKAAEQKVKAGGSGFGGGFGGFGGGGGGEQKTAPSASGTSPPPNVKQSSLLSTAAKTDTSTEEVKVSPSEEELSPLEIQIRRTEEIRLEYEQDDILRKIDQLLKNFDAELRLLRHDKFEMDIVMKNADLRQVTLFEELVLLKEFEKREDILAAKVTSKQQEKLDMQNKILEVQGKMESKKKDIEKLQEKDRTLNANFVASLGDNNKFTDYLTKVFKKKIKRTKKKATEGEGSDDDSDEDSDDESDWEESDEESDEEAGGYDLDVCPQGCDQTLYDNTCQLREKRLDIEEGLTEEKKNLDTMKKEVEGLSKKAKVIDGSLKNAQNDLEAFQLEKQQKLNELDVVVTLKLNQIQYMINNMLPQDLSQTLVFESNGVVRLQQRIKELENEKFMQKRHMKDSRRTHVQLIKDRKVFEKKIEEMEETCNEMMVSKFGRIVDLEKLETVTVNRNIEELKEKCRITEIQCAEELSELDKKIAEKRNRITFLIRDNTNRLEQLNMLMVEKKDLETSLNSRQKNLGEEYTGQRKADLNEKQRLIQLVQLQAQEIDALKEEIMLLSRKGGHILPPAQPPLPQSPNTMHNMNH